MSADFVKMLRERAQRSPERVAFRFLADGETEVHVMTLGALEHRVLKLAERLVSEVEARGERVLILVPPGELFVVAFFACLYAGSVAVPVAPPRRARGDGKLRAICDRANAAVVVSTNELWDRVLAGDELTHAQRDALRWLDIEAEATGSASPEFSPIEVSARDLAFLQFTSGSTGNPKGVQISHANLLANARALAERFGDTEETISVNWLPPYHDMGLIGGILQPIYLGAQTVIMSPNAFVQRPLRWLEAISTYGATTSGGPDFGYALCAEAAQSVSVEGIDLRSWTLAFTGAEPVRASTLARFARAFAPAGFDASAFYPCYGMAETTLFVSGGRRGAGANVLRVDAQELQQGRVNTIAEGGRQVVACGLPAVDDLLIVAPWGKEILGEGRVGEVWVRGPQVANGYYGDDEATQEAFGAILASADGPYLRTGDLGFLDDGQLFLTGRCKDLIILRGRNLYPADIEESVTGVDEALQQGAVAAIAVPEGALDDAAAGESGEGASGDGERLVVVAEVTRTARRNTDAERIGKAIRRAVVDAHAVDCHAVVLLRPGALPRTSSGKVMRLATRDALVDGGLRELARWTVPKADIAQDTGPLPTHDAPHSLAALRQRLIAEVAQASGVAPGAITAGEPWAAYGIDSLEGVRLVERLGAWVGRHLPPTLLYDFPTIDALAAHLSLTGAARQSATPDAPSTDAAEDAVAVIGVAARFPGGEDAWQWFEGLVAGRDAIGPVPSTRPAADRWRDAAERTPTLAEGGFLPDIDAAETALFGLSPREARHTDPQQRLLLETAWRALEDAAIAPKELAGTNTGVFIGISSQDYARLLVADGGGAEGRMPVHAGTGNAMSVAANRLSYRFDLRGPSLAVDTACSSSLVAVHQACASLARGECSAALVGGVNLLLSPDLSEVFAEAGMLSPGARCRTFDARADGYVRGEGCGVVVLKPLEKALADGDRVMAVIRGSAVNQDGRSNGMTAPNGHAQEAVMRAALTRARLQPHQLDYIEAHGTATSLGDPIEAHALARVFGLPEGDRPAPLRVGSVKSNIGHLEAAAGIAGLIKVVLSLATERLPGQCHFEAPNPHAPLVAPGEGSDGALQVQADSADWPRGPRRRRAGVSSFGFGGTNAHVVLEEAPAAACVAPADQAAGTSVAGISTDVATAVGVWLCERDRDALAGLAAAAAEALSTRKVTLEALARQANQGRPRFDARMALVARDEATAITALRKFAHGEADTRVILPPAASEALAAIDPGRPRIAFAFPGQGSQRAGMGMNLYARDAAFRQRLDACEAILAQCAGFSLIKLLSTAGDAGREALADTRYTQPALFAVEVSLAQTLMARGVPPAALIGHSVGEYVAACLAGVFSWEDGLRLVARRAALVAALPSGGGMLAVALSAAQASEHVVAQEPRVALAADNGPQQTVLSGARDALEPIAATLAADGVRHRWLDVSHAFHSPLLDPVLDDFGAVVAGLTLHAPDRPVYSNVTGAIGGAEMATPAYWVDHLRRTVRFREGLCALTTQGIEALVESGPGASTLTLARGIIDAAQDERTAWLAPLPEGTREDVGVAQTLAELFVRGAPVTGERAMAAIPVGAWRLPGVRFHRARHWFAERAVPAGVATRTKGHSHPLLGAPLDLPLVAGRRFEAVIGAQVPAWLADHRVADAVVMPAAGFADLMVAAGRVVLGADAAVEVRDVMLTAALTLSETEPVKLHTVVEEEGEQSYTVRVLSSLVDGAQGEGTAWTEHASGLLALAQSLDRDSTPSASPDDTGSEETIDVRRLWRDLADLGLRYGSAFQGLERLRVHGTQGDADRVAVARIAPSEQRSERRCPVPPTRLDACLQAIAPLVRERSTLLPVGWRRLRYWPPANDQTWTGHIEATVRLTAAREAALEVRSAHGALVLAIDGLQLAPVPGLGDSADGDEVRDAMHRVDWVRCGRFAGPLSRLPAPSTACDELAPGFEYQLSHDEGVAAYREGLAALETRSRTLAQQLVPQIEALGHARSTKTQRLLDRLRVLAAEAPEVPADRVSSPAVEVESRLLERCAERVPEVLSGACDPVAELLFPGGDASELRAIYGEAAGPRLMNAQVAGVVAQALCALSPDEGLRVLEIGAGTGATSEPVLAALPAARGAYTLTDIGAPLVQAAVERLSRRYRRVQGQVLDISREPQAQRLAVRQTDIVIAANVLHATPSFGETLRNVRELLVPGGWLVLLEGTRRLGWLDLTFGLTDGWWCFEPDQYRDSHPLVDAEGWTRALRDAGFSNVARLGGARASDLEQAIIVAQVPSSVASASCRWNMLSAAGLWPQLEAALAGIPGSAAADDTLPGAASHGAVVMAAPRDGSGGFAEECESVLADALECTHAWLADRLATHADARAEASRDQRITFVTKGAVAAGDRGDALENGNGAAAEATLTGLARTLRLEQPGLRVRWIDVDDGVSTQSLAREIVADDPEDEVALRGEQRFVPRLRAFRAASDPSRLIVTEPGRLDSLAEQPLERRAPRPQEVEIAVHATGLNFRDLLQCLGLLEGGYAGDLGDEHIPLGFECAGRVSAVGDGVEHVALGDAVIGAFTPGSLASHVTLPARYVVAKPPGLAWTDAAAAPTAWLTVWFALEDLARVGPGDVVLIHAAAGGVGLAAVRYAQSRGARVLATAHPSKWPALRAEGITHLASSRDDAFADAVRAWTDDRGADVVLNSLTGDLARASLAVTAHDGRFVELGRLDGIDADTAARERPDVSHFAFDLGQMAIAGDPRLDTLVDRLGDPDLATRLSLPTTVFAHDQGEAAMRTLQAGRHVGKVVLERPAPASVGAPAGIQSEGWYVISGGTGGLGIAVAQWLAGQGASHLALLARRPPGDDAAEAIAALQRSGVRVEVLSVDVAERAPLASALEQLRAAQGRIRGVIHAAGVLADAAVENMDAQRVREVLAPKLGGAINLAEETRDDGLEVFVAFSSSAALLGSPGQSNHAAANAVLDALASRQRLAGAPWLSIGWGAWSQIGAAARKRAGDRLAQVGIGEIAPEDGLRALAQALVCDASYVAVLPVDWRRFATHTLAERPFFEERLRAALVADGEATGGMPTLDFSGLDAHERKAVLQEHLRSEIAAVLGLAEAEQVQPRSRLMDLGMDSLMAVELRARLQRSLGVALQTTLLFDHPTVEALVEYLSEQVADDGGGMATDSVEHLDRRERGPDVHQEITDPAVQVSSRAPEGVVGAVMETLMSSPADDQSLVKEVEALSEEELLRRLRS
ncbi:MAG: SDR family NAD(P)-dependent oxidoreductase [Pseudomonadota bacterium]